MNPDMQRSLDEIMKSQYDMLEAICEDSMHDRLKRGIYLERDPFGFLTKVTLSINVPHGQIHVFKQGGLRL